MNVKECKGEEKVRMVRSKKKKGCGETEPRPRPNGILTSLAPDAPLVRPQLWHGDAIVYSILLA